MKYLIKFNFNCLSKSGKVSRKTGECEITSETELEFEQLISDKNLHSSLVAEMARQSKKNVISLDINEMQLKYGICKQCGCTDTNACVHPDFGSCWWMDDSHTICSHCVELADDPAVERPKDRKLHN